VIDIDKVLRRMIVSLTTGAVSSATISKPVSFLNHYFSTTMSPEDKVIFAYDWDEYLVGLTSAPSTLEVENQTYTFSNKIGYVMGLSKNRKT
jgi:hypothetical protein